MAEQTIRLIYPPSLVNVPLINQLIRKYDVTVNILRADVSLEGGWLDLRLSGGDELLHSVFAWLKSMGVEVKEIEL